MKVKMLNTVRLLPTDLTFHKGRTYKADIAWNQPEHKAKGKIFVYKRNKFYSHVLDSMLIEKEDYQIVEP